MAFTTLACPATRGNKAAKLKAIREALRTAKRVWLATDCNGGISDALATVMLSETRAGAVVTRRLRAWTSGTNLPHHPRLGRMALPNGRSGRSAASAWIISLFSARCIHGGPCDPILGEDLRLLDPQKILAAISPNCDQTPDPASWSSIVVNGALRGHAGERWFVNVTYRTSGSAIDKTLPGPIKSRSRGTWRAISRGARAPVREAHRLALHSAMPSKCAAASKRSS
jgi:hypothetical protein